jgi:hypothetical protein
MPRPPTQRSVAQSLILFIALLLFAIAVVIAVRGMTHHSPDQRDDAVGPAIASSSGAALS